MGGLSVPHPRRRVLGQADEAGLVIIYAGHYATETLGVQALARTLAERWELPWSFLPAPTGL